MRAHAIRANREAVPTGVYMTTADEASMVESGSDVPGVVEGEGLPAGERSACQRQQEATRRRESPAKAA
jgi:hypothetical protein